MFPNVPGLYFKIRRGMYHLIVAKDSMVWEIRHPLILNEWFNAAVSWKADVGLKFYVNGDLVASDSSPSQLNALNDGPFFTVISSDKYGGHWGKSVSIDDVSVWSMSLDKETIERNSEGESYFTHAATYRK